MAVLSSKKILQENNTSDPNAIKNLTLTHKALSDVSCLGEFKNLERLDLGFNNLTSLEGLKSCMNLKWLSVAQNLLQSLKGIEGLTKLTVLNAGKNKLRSMDEVKSLLSLRALILNDNEISSLCKLDQMKELNTLVLSRNPICEIGISLAKTKSLTKLSLSNCELQKIGSSLASCVDLKELRLAHNEIKTIPDELACNAKLQNLDLGNNFIVNWSDLKVLPSLVNLKNFNLQGNPIAEKENLAKKIKKLVPNLQIFNARPIDKPMIKKGDKINGSSLDDGNKLDSEKGKQIGLAIGSKKSKKHILLNEDEDDPLHNMGDFDMEKKLKFKKHKKNEKPKEQASNVKKSDSREKKTMHSRLKQKGDNIADNVEKELNHKKVEQELLIHAALDHEGDIPISRKSDKKSKKLKQNKVSVVDVEEPPIVGFFATGVGENAISNVLKMDHKNVSDVEVPVGLVTSPTKRKKKRSQAVHPAFLQLSPVTEVGLGGSSTWDDQ